MYSNEYLEHWGTVYVVARLREQGILFQKFLEDPWGCLKAVSLQSAHLCMTSGYRPLLPRQVRVAQALWRRWEPQTEGGGRGIPEPDENRALMEAGGSKP